MISLFVQKIYTIDLAKRFDEKKVDFTSEEIKILDFFECIRGKAVIFMLNGRKSSLFRTFFRTFFMA